MPIQQPTPNSPYPADAYTPQPMKQAPQLPTNY